MYKTFLPTLLAVLVIFGVFGGPALASNDYAWFSDAELDELLGPVALYPDPILAQILPAATFTDQLSEAYTLTNLKGGSKLIDDQDWDVSIKSIAHYPSVLKMMMEKSDWTTSIGQAYVDQPEDVMRSIQRLRGRAKLMGYLTSSREQDVIYDQQYIRIVPADPQYIYVPVYEPSIVYVSNRSRYDARVSRDYFSFSIGFMIGSWLNRDCDWRDHRVFYHGWDGDGWIGRSRSHVTIYNNVYVNNYYSRDRVNVNRRVVDRDVTDYRREVKRNEGTYRLPSNDSRRVAGFDNKPRSRDTQTIRQDPRPDKPIFGLPVFKDDPKKQNRYDTPENNRRPSDNNGRNQTVAPVDQRNNQNDRNNTNNHDNRTIRTNPQPRQDDRMSPARPDNRDVPATRQPRQDNRVTTTRPNPPATTNIYTPRYQPTEAPKRTEQVKPRQESQPLAEALRPSPAPRKETPKYESKPAPSVKDQLFGKNTWAKPSEGKSKDSDNKDKRR